MTSPAEPPAGEELEPTKLDRALQRRILEGLAEIYPQTADASEFGGWTDVRTLNANVSYLHEHGLVRGQFGARLASGETLVNVAATARGLDFLADDGGLSAILGVVMVKLHDDTIRELLLMKVAESDAPPTVKARLAETIRSLPAEALKTVTLGLVQAGLAHLPDVAPLLQTLPFLGSPK